MITITINGEGHQFQKGLKLIEMLAKLGLNKDKVAIEKNLEIVPRSTLDNVVLEEGDRLEIVHFIGGGKKSDEEL